MKKKILSFIFAICLIVPCMFMLTACGDKDKEKFNVNISTFKNGIQTALKDGVKEIALVNATGIEDYTSAKITHTISDELGMETKQFEVEEGSKLVLLVTLEPGYVINNVTIQPDGYNGETVEPEEAYIGEPQDSWVYSFVVTESLSKGLWVVFDGEPAKRTQTITLTQSNVDFFNQANPDFPDVFPASQVLADAEFSLYYGDAGIPNTLVFDDISLTELKAKIDEGFSFEVLSGSILQFEITPYYANPEDDSVFGLVDLSYKLFEEHLCSSGSTTFTRYSSSITITTFENTSINFDWTKFDSLSMNYGVQGIRFNFNHEEQDFVAKTAGGTQIEKPWYADMSFEDYFENVDEGIKLETTIDSTIYASLVTGTFAIDGINYISFADAVSQGLVAIDNETNPTKLTVTLKNTSGEIKNSLYFYINFLY